MSGLPLEVRAWLHSADVRIRGLGYRPDRAHRRWQPLYRGRLQAAAAPLPKSASLEQYEAEVEDQGDTGSCGGHGTSQAIDVSFSAAGAPLPFVPSPDGIYRATRQVMRAAATPLNGTLPALEDNGVEPADIVTALGQEGVRALRAPTPDGRYSDCDPMTVNDEGNFLDVEESRLAIVTGDVRIDEMASNFVDAMRAALAGAMGEKPCALGMGVFVDSAFEDWAPSQGPIDGRPNFADPNGGGHWLCLDSYDTSASGLIVFRGPNSWGASWGDRGHYEVTETWLRASCSDCLLFRATLAAVRTGKAVA